MKIQNINNWNNQPKAAKSAKAPDNSFEYVLKSQANNDRSIENALPRSHTAANSEKVDSVRPLALPNMRQIELAGLKDLVKDSFSDTSNQILCDIDSLCSDETGENVDMKLLNELLGLCTEKKDEIQGGQK